MSDENLVAALDDLWKAGAIQLPHMAVQYAQSNRDAHNAGWRESEGFDRNMIASGRGIWYEALKTSTTPSPVAEPFQALRQLLQQAVGHTAEQLEASGRALVIIGESYADEDTATELEILRSERYDAAPEYDLDTPPEEIPEVRDVDDPHVTTIRLEFDGIVPSVTKVPTR